MCQVAHQDVLPVLHLYDGTADLVTGLVPALRVAADAAALDLDGSQAHAGPHDEQVDLELAVVFDERHGVEQGRFVRELVAQRLPRRALGLALLEELGLFGEAPGHRHFLPAVAQVVAIRQATPACRHPLFARGRPTETCQRSALASVLCKT
ncbi:MAG: hypothetical protein JWP14_1578 [Frankiales bacterium]|nr:hypothetical protein [Frankiales bacterium]